MIKYKYTRWFIFVTLVVFVFFVHHTEAAVIIVQQTDGSISAWNGTGYNNAYSNITVGSQVFVPNVSANLGSLEIFTSNFGTQSRDPDYNTCYVNIYNQDTNTFLASSDNGFNGFGCAGDLIFTFNNSQPLLQAGTHYRWDYVFGLQNFSSITFAGSPNNTVGGTFSVPPVVNAEFTAYGIIEQPTSISQFQADGITPISEGGTASASTVVLSALLPSFSPDLLQLQIEVEPSYVSFKNQPNFLSAFVNSGLAASVSVSSLPNGVYHWQARAVDQQGNKSLWQTISNPPASTDFIVHDSSSDIVLEDNSTGYSINTQPNPCFGDGSLFSCALSPAFNNYIVESSFSISKITFDWRNNGSNNCAGYGNYGVIITSANLTNSVIAMSMNTVYLGCGGTSGTGELDFTGETIPSNFYLTFGAFDGLVQGGSAISVSNVTIYTSLTTPSLSLLQQYKSDAITAISEGQTTTEDMVVFGATLQSSSINQLQLEVQYTTSTSFDQATDITSQPVSSGSNATITVQNFINGSYRWRARVVDTITQAKSNWQEFGTSGNTDFIINNLGQDAASLAKLVINDPYLGDGSTWGGKGWDAYSSLYVTPDQIGSGYFYWNNSPSMRAVLFGAGLDCSGLVEWAFNRSFDPFKSLTHNIIRWDGANGQYLHNSTPLIGSLKPGDLLFLDQDGNGVKDHVGMYASDGNQSYVIEARSPRQGIVSSAVADFESRSGFVANQDLRRVVLSPALGGFLKAGSPIDLAVTDPDGFTINAMTSIQTSEELLREVPGQLYYSESELGSDGRPEGIIYWPAPKTGNYLLKAIPQAGVSSTSTYSLTFQTGSTTILLAQNVPISQIPSQGYGVTTSATGTISSFIPVLINIKSGTYPNSINLGSNGVVPVAIFGSATFDVHQINAASTTLANASIKLKGNGEPAVSYSDINDDGFTDITVKVLTDALQLTSLDVQAELDGFLTTGQEFKGSDSVRIVPQ